MPMPSLPMPSFMEVCKGTAAGGAAMFTGGALYINVAEHPARMKVKDVVALRTQWKESFLRARKLQGGTALVSVLAGVAAWHLEESDDRWLWLVGAGYLSLVFPYTMFVMKPDINTLLDDNVIADKGEEWVKENIDKWNKRHIVRTCLGWLASECFMYALYCKHS